MCSRNFIVSKHRYLRWGKSCSEISILDFTVTAHRLKVPFCGPKRWNGSNQETRHQWPEILAAGLLSRSDKAIAITDCGSSCPLPYTWWKTVVWALQLVEYYSGWQYCDSQGSAKQGSTINNRTRGSNLTMTIERIRQGCYISGYRNGHGWINPGSLLTFETQQQSCMYPGEDLDICSWSWLPTAKDWQRGEGSNMD